MTHKCGWGKDRWEWETRRYKTGGRDSRRGIFEDEERADAVNECVCVDGMIQMGDGRDDGKH